jgi:hypothetical protein
MKKGLTIETLFFQSLFAVLSLAECTCICEYVYGSRAFQFEHQIEFVALFLFVGALAFVNRQKKKLLGLQKALWKLFFASWPAIRMAHHSGRILSIGLLSVFIIANIVCIRAYVGEFIAYSCQFLQKPMLAERIFKFTKLPGDFSFVTVSNRGKQRLPGTGHLNIDRAVIDKQNIDLDLIIAAVYGSESKEMAFRYKEHAEAFKMHFIELSFCSKYARKSFELYRNLGCNAESLSSLADVAFVQMNNGDRAGLQESLDIAYRMSAGMHTELMAKVLQRFCNIAEAGRLDSTPLRARLTQCNAERAKCSVGAVDTGEDMLIATLIMLILRPITFGTLVRFARMRWQRNLRSASSTTEALLTLERLVTLELYSGNIARADSYSRQSLQLAEKVKVA